MTTFKEAAEAHDHQRVYAMLAEDVTLTSPVAFKPYQGKRMTAAVLANVIQVFEDFHYIREITSADGRDQALIFQAHIGDVQVTGCDFLHYDDAGLIDDFLVMVRPLSAAKALAAAMEARFDGVRAQAAEE